MSAELNPSEAEAPIDDAYDRAARSQSDRSRSDRSHRDIARDVRRVARSVFGWKLLRAGQLEVIESVLRGTDTLAVMPTGYGKSALYQIAGALLDGVTVVVSPLIALQEDQVAGLATHQKAPRAAAVNSSRSDFDNDHTWEALAAGEIEYLFLSPEQLANDHVLEKLAAARVSLFVVDEAHCVSAWGHDFRPDYLRLADAIERLGRPTVLALTATGSAPVRDEIVERLALQEPAVFTRGYDRPNLSLAVVRHVEGTDKRRAVVEQVAALPKPGLVYVSTRKDTELYAEALGELGIRSLAYHAGLSRRERTRAHEDFVSDGLDVVVATSAFGMGIDKPNVRFVVHASITDSIDSYYQEIGRAGRDGEDASITLHYRAEDLGLRTFFGARSPQKASVRILFSLLSNVPLRLSDISEQLGIPMRKLSGIANLLEEAKVIESTEQGLRVIDDISPDDAVRRAVEAAESRERIDASRLAMMRHYAETRACRRITLLGYFGEELTEPCGNCDTCADGTAREEADDAATEAATDSAAGDDTFTPDAHVQHSSWGAGTVMGTDGDRLTVFFETEGYKVLSIEAVEERSLLTIVPDGVEGAVAQEASEGSS